MYVFVCERVRMALERLHARTYDLQAIVKVLRWFLLLIAIVKVATIIAVFHRPDAQTGYWANGC